MSEIVRWLAGTWPCRSMGAALERWARWSQIYKPRGGEERR